MNISPEQIEEAIKAAGGYEEPEVNPIIEIIEAATQTTTVKNVVKMQGGEVRCIVTNDNQIKPTTLTDGYTTQEYIVENEDVIAWISLINGDRQFAIQDKHGINSVTAEAFGPLFGSKTGYALSYLGSFGGDNNILLDDEKVANYHSAEIYADKLLGESHNDLKTLITSRCTNSPNYQDNCQTWEEAELFEIDENEDRTVVWGVRAATTDRYVKFDTTYVLIWVNPVIMDADGVAAPEDILQVVTRQVQPNLLPQLGPDSNAVFEVTETLNTQVKAYAIVTEDTVTGLLQSIKLFKVAGFDVNKASF